MPIFIEPKPLIKLKSKGRSVGIVKGIVTLYLPMDSS